MRNKQSLRIVEAPGFRVHRCRAGVKVGPKDSAERSSSGNHCLLLPGLGFRNSVSAPPGV